MTSPIPKKPLEGHCSVVYDNTLYVFGPGAFQALPLKKGAKWARLPSGTSVTGAACVRQAGNTTSTNDALWVIGGTATRSTSKKYSGLQKYTFATKKWQTVSPVVPVTRNRQSHAAVYLPSSSQILVYAGSQDGSSIPTIETYLISTSSPYDVLAFTSTKLNPPVVLPQLLQWDDGSAITVGGYPPHNKIYRFDVSQGGWSQYSTSLKSSPKNSTEEAAALVEGSDGSKTIQLYDLGVSPNQLSEFVLQDASGQPASTGVVPGLNKSKKRKRDLTLQDWPPYKAKTAPKATRTGFGLSQSSDGLVAISGGSDSNPVQLFNQDTNSWVNGKKFFGRQPHHQQRHFHTNHGNHGNNGGSHTNQNSPSPSSSPNSQSNDHSQTSMILGATLGTILGLITLLVILLLVLRWRRQKKRQAAEEAREQEEKGRLSFADRGDPFMKEIGASGYHMHEPQSIPAPPMADSRIGHRRSETRGSENSTTHLVPKKNDSSDSMEMGPIREKPGLRIPPIKEADSKTSSLQVPGPQTKRTSGWSRYFSGVDMSTKNSARNSAATKTPRGSTADIPAAAPVAPQRKSGLSASSSQSSRDSTRESVATSAQDRSTLGPMEIPPLDMGQTFSDNRINRVVTGNNVIGGPSAERRHSNDRPRTVSSTFSGPESTFTDTFTHEGQDEATSWTPVTRSDYAAAPVRNTATSSIYGSTVDGGEPLFQQGPRFSVPVTGTARTVSGATIIQRNPSNPAPEPDYSSSHAATSGVAKVVNVPATKPAEQAIVQDDMGWIDLGARH